MSYFSYFSSLISALSFPTWSMIIWLHKNSLTEVLSLSVLAVVFRIIRFQRNQLIFTSLRYKEVDDSFLLVNPVSVDVSKSTSTFSGRLKQKFQRKTLMIISWKHHHCHLLCLLLALPSWFIILCLMVKLYSFVDGKVVFKKPHYQNCILLSISFTFLQLWLGITVFSSSRKCKWVYSYVKSSA